MWDRALVINSLAPGESGCYFKNLIFNPVSSGGRTFGGMGVGGGGPPSWICDVTSGRHLGFVVTSFPVAIQDLWSHDFRSCDFRSRDLFIR